MLCTYSKVYISKPLVGYSLILMVCGKPIKPLYIEWVCGPHDNPNRPISFREGNGYATSLYIQERKKERGSPSKDPSI